MKMNKKTIGITALAVVAIIALIVIVVCVTNRDTSNEVSNNITAESSTNENEQGKTGIEETELTEEQKALVSWLDKHKIEVTATLDENGIYSYESDVLGTLQMQDGLQVDKQGNVYSIIGFNENNTKAYMLTMDDFAQYVNYISTGFPMDIDVENQTIPSDAENPPEENIINEPTSEWLDTTAGEEEDLFENNIYYIVVDDVQYNFAKEEFVIASTESTWSYLGITNEDGYEALVAQFTSTLGEANTYVNDDGEITEYSWYVGKDNAYILIASPETENEWVITTIPNRRIQ